MSTNGTKISVLEIDSFETNFKQLGVEITDSQNKIAQLMNVLGTEAFKNGRISPIITRLASDCKVLGSKYQEISTIVEDGLDKLRNFTMQTEEESANIIENGS